jgi:hypothetical protein
MPGAIAAMVMLMMALALLLLGLIVGWQMARGPTPIEPRPKIAGLLY